MNELVQLSFDYSVFDADTATFLQETADKIIGRTRRCAYENGKDLLAAKKRVGHGHFVSWVRSEFGWSEDTAQRQMNVALRFGEIPQNAVFDDTALYLLSKKTTPEEARQEAKERADDGEKITLDIAQQIIEAKEAQKRAEESERQSRLELNQQIAALQEQIETMSKPKEVEKFVTPPEVKAKVESLQEKVNKLTEQRDNLSKKAEELGKEAREAALKRNEEERERKTRQEWRKLTKDFQIAVVKMLSQLPTAIDVQVFESDDWERLSQAKELARRFISECDNLSRSPSMIIEAGWQVPYAVES